MAGNPTGRKRRREFEDMGQLKPSTPLQPRESLQLEAATKAPCSAQSGSNGMSAAPTASIECSLSTSKVNSPKRLQYQQSESNLYQPLRKNETRVLRLSPGEFGSQLYASLEVIPLEARECGRGKAGSRWHGQPFRNVKRKDRISCKCNDCYEALSYVWGDPVFPNRITIHGHGQVPITKSLYTCLQYLRFANFTRSLWIDALCINQDDLEERAAQVAVMSDVYRLAYRVLIWLGICGTTDPLTVVFTDYQSSIVDSLAAESYDSPMSSSLEVGSPLHAKIKQQVVAFGGDLPDTLTCPCCSLEFSCPADPLSSALEGLAKIYENPWFTRLWVLQEAAFAQTAVVHLGAHVIDWAKLIEVSENMRRYAAQHPEVIKRKSSVLFDLGSTYTSRFALRLNQWENEVKLRFFLQKLTEHSNLRCTDPRDRVFAIRSLLDVEDIAQLEPDYVAPMEDLWRKLATACIEMERSPDEYPKPMHVLLDLIGTESTIERRDDARSTLPTWAVDVGNISTRSQWTANLAQDWRDSLDLNNENDGRLRCRILPGSMNRIEIGGQIFAVIERMFADCDGLDDYRKEATDEHLLWSSLVPRLIAWLTACLQPLYQQSGQYVHNGFCGLTDNSLFFVQSLSGKDYGVPLQWVDRKMPSWEHLKDRAKDAFRLCQPSIPVDGPICKTWIDLAPFMTSLAPAFLDLGRNLAFIRGSQTGYFAWVCSTSRITDKVAMIPGYMHPYVLRESSDNSYTMRGSAWCDGFEQWHGLELTLREWTVILGCAEKPSTVGDESENEIVKDEESEVDSDDEDEDEGSEVKYKVEDIDFDFKKIVEDNETKWKEKREKVTNFKAKMARLAAWEVDNIGWITIC